MIGYIFTLKVENDTEDCQNITLWHGKGTNTSLFRGKTRPVPYEEIIEKVNGGVCKRIKIQTDFPRQFVLPITYQNGAKTDKRIPFHEIEEDAFNIKTVDLKNTEWLLDDNAIINLTVESRNAVALCFICEID